MSHQRKCPQCKKSPRSSRRLPYGAKRVRSWCDNCDAYQVDNVSKAKERKKNKVDYVIIAKPSKPDLTNKKFIKKLLKFE